MNPERFNKPSKKSPDSHWQVLQSIISLALILCGLTGISVHVFNGDFSLTDAIYWFTNSIIHTILALVTALLLYLFHRYVTNISNARHQSASNLPMYFMMLMGVFFAFRLITTGQW